ncbi:MAG: hypothetical protein AAB772_02515 [Patescibacteria group bacterium]
MGKIKLYDVENYDYPNSSQAYENGFRSVQVFKCRICGALTNLVVRRNDSSLGVRPICPNHMEKWHFDLKEKLFLRVAFSHPASYKKELEQEITEMLDKISDKISRDVRGDLPEFQRKLFFD